MSFGFSDLGDGSDLRNQPTLDDFVFRQQGNAEWKTVESNIDQIQLDGIRQSDEDSLIDEIKIGAAYTINSYKSTFGAIRFLNWFGGVSEGQDPNFYDTLYHEVSSGEILDQLDGGLDPTSNYYTLNFQEFIAAQAILHERYLPTNFSTPYSSVDWGNFRGPKGNPSETNSVEESTNSAYIQFLFDSQNRFLPFEIITGLRYEQTDVNAISEFAGSAAIRWITPSSLTQDSTETSYTRQATHDYSFILPNLDIRFDITDKLVLRTAYSESITRPSLELLIAKEKAGPVSLTSIGSVTEGNSQLEPFTSKNTDLSLEYYYSDDHFVSIAGFTKTVEGYPESSDSLQPVLELTDVYNGPRAEAIREDLATQGIPVTDENVFDAMLAAYPPTPSDYGIAGDENDPLFLFRTRTPVNGDETTVTCYEFAWQPFFGNSGFGTFINYTKIDSDAPIEFDIGVFDNALPSSQDFANLVGFYDKHGLQVRFALHWREEISNLNETTDGTIPIVQKPYKQLDALISYSFSDHFTAFIEGINITNEEQVTYHIVEERLSSVEQFGPRYHLGFRSRF